MSSALGGGGVISGRGTSVLRAPVLRSCLACAAAAAASAFCCFFDFAAGADCPLAGSTGAATPKIVFVVLTRSLAGGGAVAGAGAAPGGLAPPPPARAAVLGSF